MKLRAFLLSALAAALTAGFPLTGCRTVDPVEPDTVLRLKLHDSLSRYDRVQIEILDLEMDSALVKVLWNSALSSPGTEIETYSLKDVSGDAFLVRVRGYANGEQLALETHIIYEAGRKSVTHVKVPPMVPRNKLSRIKPSIGSLSPLFHRDSLNYLVTLPLGVQSISFELTAAYSGARISFDGDSVKSGTSTEPRAIDTAADSAFVRVTDLLDGKASTLTYKLIIRPTKPAELLMASMTPSAGVLDPAFTPENTSYTLLLPPGIDTVSFELYPSDPATMTLTFMETVIFPGEKSPIITLSDSSPAKGASIWVLRGSERVVYQVAVIRSDP